MDLKILQYENCNSFVRDCAPIKAFVIGAMIFDAAHSCAMPIRVLSEAPNEQRVTLRAIVADHIQRSLTFCGINDLPDSEHGCALVHAEHLGDIRVSRGGIDFFIGIREFDSEIVLECGEK